MWTSQYGMRLKKKKKKEENVKAYSKMLIYKRKKIIMFSYQMKFEKAQ